MLSRLVSLLVLCDVTSGFQLPSPPGLWAPLWWDARDVGLMHQGSIQASIFLKNFSYAHQVQPCEFCQFVCPLMINGCHDFARQGEQDLCLEYITWIADLDFEHSLTNGWFPFIFDAFNYFITTGATEEVPENMEWAVLADKDVEVFMLDGVGFVKSMQNSL